MMVPLSAEPAQTSHWSLDGNWMEGLSFCGEVMRAEGVKNQSLIFPGNLLVELDDSADLSYGGDGLSSRTVASTSTPWPN